MPYTNNSQSTADASNDSRAENPKTIPPTFINLNDCKPILSTTTTNTSTNTSANGTTAFVFTSSRTLRALQDEESSSFHAGSNSSIPSTPSTTLSDHSYHPARSRASLTLSQLVRHSDGAVDARSLLGPKMRAAGFVTLPNTLSSRSEQGCPGTPSSSAFTGTYSSNTSSSSSSAGSSEFMPGPRQGFAFTPGPRPEYSPASSTSPPVVQASRRPALELASSSSGSDSFGSSSTFASGISTSTSLSSVEETDEDVLRAGSRANKGKARVVELEPTEYPFPTGRESPQSHGSRGSRGSSATASPTIIHAAPADVCPVSYPSTSRQDPKATKPLTPGRQSRPSAERRDKAKKSTMDREAKPAPPPTPTFAAAKRPGFGRQYSLTELCDASPFVWMSKSEMFAPPAPISRSPVRSKAVSISTPAASRPRPPVDPPHPQPPGCRHRRHHTTEDGRSHPTDPTGRVHRILSAPLRMPTIPTEPVLSPDHDNEKARKLDRKLKARDAAPGGNIPGRPETILHGVSAPHAQNAAGRGRDPRGKILGASETAEKRAAAQAEADMDREKAEALDGLAALALAHKEREFESARNIIGDRERAKVLKQKQRMYHKLRGKPLQEDPPSESEATMVDQQTSAVKIVP